MATDLKTGKEVWLREGSLIEVVRASISLPGIFTPCGRNGQWLVDGGLMNPVPASLCRAMGADFLKQVQLNGRLKLFGQIFQEQPDRSPTLFDVLATSVNIMQDRITQQRLLEDPPEIVIRPRLSDIGLMEFNRAAEAIEEGKREMDMNLPALRELMVTAE